MARRYKINQILEFNAGSKIGWIKCKVTQFSLEEDRYCILLDENWNGDYEWWVPDIDLRIK